MLLIKALTSLDITLTRVGVLVAVLCIIMRFGYVCTRKIFRMQSLYGKGLDWPITYDELRPYYDRIQSEVGISGDAQAERWRPSGEPYPMPPLPQFSQAKIIAKGFKKLGMHTAPIPMAINSVEYQGRPPCIFDGWCDAGCPTGALANPLTTLFAPGKTIRRTDKASLCSHQTAYG